MYENIKYEVIDGIGHLTISRPKALNALNTATLIELQKCVDEEINPNDDVHVVIVTGEGRSFIAGADILEMKDATAQEGHAYALRGHKLMNTIERSPKIFIAAINGFALGGGLELSMSCDIRLASEKALFGQPEVGLGITPGFGGTQRLTRLVGKGMAKYLILSAQNIHADEAYRIGLVEKVYAPDDLLPEAEKLAKTIASKAPIAVSQSKADIDFGYDADMTTGSRFEAEAFIACFASEDKLEGMTAFVEKRAPEFKNK